MSETGQDPWRIEVYRARLERSLSARFFLRLHVSAILLGTLAAGYAVDMVLLRVGLRPILLRYPLAILAAYAAFAVGIKLWLEHSGIAEYVDRRKAALLVGDDLPAAPPPPNRSSALDWLDGFSTMPDGEAILILVAVVVAVFALGGYALIAPEALFANIVLEVLLAAGLLRGVRRMQSSGWLAGLWSSTWPSLAFTLCIAVMLGLYARHVPEAATLADLYHHVRQPSGAH